MLHLNLWGKNEVDTKFTFALPQPNNSGDACDGRNET